MRDRLETIALQGAIGSAAPPLAASSDGGDRHSERRATFRVAVVGNRKSKRLPAAIMVRLIPASTTVEYHRATKIAGEDVVEEELMPEPDVMDAIPRYDHEARSFYFIRRTD